VAAVLTFVRNAFGNKAPAVSSEKVKQIRAEIADKTGFYSPAELNGEKELNTESQ